MIKSYIINLDRNPERMSAMRGSFGALGLPYERFSAVDGQKIPEEVFREFARARPQVKILGKWTKGSAGCFLSHFELIKSAASSPYPYTAIFEDDLHIADSLKDLLQDKEWIPGDADIIRLESSAQRIHLSKHDVKHVAGRKLQKILPNRFRAAWPVGAGAYIIKREAAQRYIEMSESLHLYVDHLLFDCTVSAFACGVNTYQLVPACCGQDKFVHQEGNQSQKFHSNIETGIGADIYRSQNNSFLRALKEQGGKIGILQTYKKLRSFIHILYGYRKVPFAK